MVAIVVLDVALGSVGGVEVVKVRARVVAEVKVAVVVVSSRRPLFKPESIDKNARPRH